jgi:predicted DNA-binding transcriptional regulator AlpA
VRALPNEIKKAELQKYTEAYPINAFCAAFGISRSLFYELRKKGEGPRTFKIKSHTFVSKQAAADWAAALEQAST